MNLDNHYYGTYYISRVAGFSHNDALDIAWAAQTVDECHIANMEKLAKAKGMSKEEFGNNENDFILTLTDTEDGLAHLRSSLQLCEMDFDDTDHLTALRAMWMPFHFLPGNYVPKGGLNLDVKTYFGELGSGDSNLKNQDLHDKDLMCRTSTGTCYCMITNARKTYQLSTGLPGLFAVGIVMHVLADTWSHEFFCGSPNQYINHMEKATDLAGNLLRMIDSNTESPYTMVNLGHGQAGREPDSQINDYYMYPAWLSKQKENQNRIRRNNPVRFSNAFLQMYATLCYIKDPSRALLLTELDENRLKNFSRDPMEYPDEKVFEKIHAMVKLFMDVERKRKRVELEHSISIGHSVSLSLKGYDFSGYWIDLIHEKYPEDNIPRYEFPTFSKKGDPEKDIKRIQIFMEAAKKHRDCVINYIIETYEYQGKKYHVFSDKKVDKAVRRFFLESDQYNTDDLIKRVIIEERLFLIPCASPLNTLTKLTKVYNKKNKM